MTNGATNVLDMDSLNELRSLLDDGLDELLQEYLDDSQRLLGELESAAEAGDREALITHSHALKGSSGNLGVAAVYRRSEALERDLREGEVADVMERVSVLKQDYRRACEALAEIIQH